MGIVLNTFSEDLYKVHDFVWDKDLKAYSHIYYLNKHYHLEVLIKSSIFEITLFDDNGKSVEYLSKGIKKLSQKEILYIIDATINELLEKRELL